MSTPMQKRRIVDSDDDDDDDGLWSDPESPPPVNNDRRRSPRVGPAAAAVRPLSSAASSARTAHARRKGKSGTSQAPSAAVNTFDSRQYDQDIQKAAKRKVEHVGVPTTVTSTSQLHWHRVETIGRYSSDVEYYPCRTCQPDEIMGRPDLPKTWDQSQKVLVQYIVYPNVGEWAVVPRNDLVPFHGRSDRKKRRLKRVNGATTRIAEGSWCENLMELYRTQRKMELQRDEKKKKSKKRKKSQNDIMIDVFVQCFYLAKILNAVRDTDEVSGSSDASCSSDSDVNGQVAVDRGNLNGNRSSTFDNDVASLSSSNDEEDALLSWSQERDSRLKSRQSSKSKQRVHTKHPATSKQRARSSSSDSSSCSSDDDAAEASWIQERDNRIKARRNQADARYECSDSSESKSNSTRFEGDKKGKAEVVATKRLRALQKKNLDDTNDSMSLESNGDDDSDEEDESSARESTSRDGLHRKKLDAAAILVHHSEESDVDNASDCEPLDEPYTQDLGLLSDDDYLPSFALEGEKANPIRPGDVVEYYSHVYVAGDKRGRRIAKVLSVDPERSPILVLDNGECIPSDTQIRRTKVMIGGTLRAHSGIYRPIENFKLIKCLPSGSSGVAAGLAKEVRRVGEVISRNMAEFQEKAQADGFAPMDLMNRYKGAPSASRTRKSSRMTSISAGPSAGSSKPLGTSRSVTSSRSRVAITRQKKAQGSLPASSALGETSSEEKQRPTNRPIKYDQKAKCARNTRTEVLSLGDSSSSDDEFVFFNLDDLLSSCSSSSDNESSDDERICKSGASTRESTKRKSPDQMKRTSNHGSTGGGKISKRDPWGSSPRKKKNSPKHRDNLSFDSSDDDAFESKSARKIVVSEKKASKKKRERGTATSKSEAPSSPLIDMTGSGENEKKAGGWLEPIGDKKTPEGPASRAAAAETGKDYVKEWV
eukprot:CAMPEP_0178592068 /NCGR_PEP_ID=MMETSP0697-20121206/29146_1 /TAXON_ID=265572 /ORGANISM="Extubocellulus spinifer, Strain CCMP396" /LENGTH=934 /DNA_ID=CAMNT_0020229013 /DNA_START=32 /DNA_END=2837 /DNA_ORIENTATION=+